jgi:alanine racemase
MSRPARALLDSEALRHNLAQVRRCAPRARVMAVVKANGYGHGLLWVAQALADADAFAVASVEEGGQLRRGGIRQPVTVLEGFFSADEIPLLVENGLEPVIHHAVQLQQLEAATAAPATVWIKVDSGMHRVGFAPEDFGEAWRRIKALRGVRRMRVMTHFASADETGDAATAHQMQVFGALIKDMDVETSLANSAGIVAWPASHGEWVRPGIMLYGASPVNGRDASDLGLRPVMTLESALITVQQRRRGDAIGYGGDWVCPEDMPVGVVAIGYGDGYPRHVRAGTPVLVNGTRAALIGRVSMDMITLDLRAVPRARIGDRVVLWGAGLAVDEIAHHAGTISYELLCHVTERIPRVDAAPAD